MSTRSERPYRVWVDDGLGLDAISAFVDHDPLRKVHPAVFAVLALESEPVDPRL